MSYPDVILAATPVLYLPCLDAVGAAFADATGHGHDGTGTNAVAGDSDAFLVDSTCGFLEYDLALSAATSPFYGAGCGATIDIAGASSLPVGANQPCSFEMWAACECASTAPSLTLGIAAADYNDGFAQLVITGANEYSPFAVAMEIVSISAGGGLHATGGGLSSPRCWHYWCGTWTGEVFALYRDGTPLALSLSAEVGPPTFTPAQAQLAVPLTASSRAHVAHVAIYDRVLSAAEVAEHYAAAWPRTDAACFSGGAIPEGPIPFPQPWLRLTHATGTSHIQQDGRRIQMRADDLDVLHLPLPVLAGPPARYVGIDAISGLPASAPLPPPPAPPQLTAAPLTPPVAPPTTCTQVRCGVAFACVGHLSSLYSQWANLINGALGALGGAMTAAALVLLLDPVTIGISVVVWSFLRGSIAGLASSVFASGCGGLTDDQIGTLRKALFCVLTCTGDVCTVDAATLQAWSNRLIAQGWPGLDQLQAIVLNALILYTPAPEFQAKAAVSSARTDCDGWTCA